MEAQIGNEKDNNNVNDNSYKEKIEVIDENADEGDDDVEHKNPIEIKK